MQLTAFSAFSFFTGVPLLADLRAQGRELLGTLAAHLPQSPSSGHQQSAIPPVLSTRMRPEGPPAGAAGSALSQRSKLALQAWQEADDAAREAERCLYAAWDAYRSSRSSVPALLQSRATEARALARSRLDEAIAARKAAADEQAP
jgi:hypothetical protein